MISRERERGERGEEGPNRGREIERGEGRATERRGGGVKGE